MRSLHLVFESHDGRALVPIPKRSTSPRGDIATLVVDSLKALDLERPIREADVGADILEPPLRAKRRPEQVQQYEAKITR